LILCAGLIRVGDLESCKDQLLEQIMEQLTIY
jgi:hypothetical protein